MRLYHFFIVVGLSLLAVIIISFSGKLDFLHAKDVVNSNQLNQLVLTMNKKEMLHNDKKVWASQPSQLKNGKVYVALNGIAQPFGFKLSYDATTREAMAVSGSVILRFKAGSSLLNINGRNTFSSAPAISLNGSLMIPLLTWAELTSSKVNTEENRTVVTWQSTSKIIEHPSALRVSDNGRFLVTSDGSPFFWLADTAWEIIQRLTRSEVEDYLRSTAERGFNVIQIAALTHFWDGSIPNAYGDLPLAGTDPNKPLTTSGSDPSSASQYDYWDHADFVIDTAASNGIYVALLPTWGKYIIDNSGPAFKQPYQRVFDHKSSYDFGKWIGSRYANRSNIVWVLGGDRAPDDETKKELIRQMAKGIQDGGGNQLATFHPIGLKSSSEWFHNEPWLDFNMYQSGHQSVDFPNFKVISSDYLKMPVKPVLDAEPRYENSGIDFNPSNGRFTPYDVRQAAYWSVFAGAFGHTYGHGAIWQLYSQGHPADEVVYWYEALEAPGRKQMQYVRKLLESRPYIDRVPDQTLLSDTLSGGHHLQATRGTNYAMIYSPRGGDFTVQMGKISGDIVTAYWYNPRTGSSDLIGSYANAGTQVFHPPSGGIGHDWILVLDDEDARFTAP